MIKTETFFTNARRYGFDLFTGVPCSYLKPLINYAYQADEIRYVPAANEGDAIALSAGTHLGGRRMIVGFQNSGLGNAVIPLTSLTKTFGFPFFLMSRSTIKWGESRRVCSI